MVKPPMHAEGTGRTNWVSDEVTHHPAVGWMPQLTSQSRVIPMVERVIPMQRDVRYDHQAGQARMPVEVVLRDGSTVRTDLVMDPSQLYAASVQIERALRARESARSVGTP